MKQIPLSEGIEITATFEQTLTNLGLTYERLALKKYKQCIHWHIRQPGQKGVLEATYLLEGHRLWLEQRPGREAAWQEPIVEEIQSRLSNKGEL